MIKNKRTSILSMRGVRPDNRNVLDDQESVSWEERTKGMTSEEKIRFL